MSADNCEFLLQNIVVSGQFMSYFAKKTQRYYKMMPYFHFVGGESLFTLFASLTYAYHYLMTLTK